MDHTKLRATCLAILIACITGSGFADQSYEQLLNEEAAEVIVDPVSANPKQQTRKSPARKSRQSNIKREKFESGLNKKFPATFLAYSTLTNEEQQKIYKAYKANTDCDFIYNLIISIATQ
ncbi:MAG TPA: hypothetical protein EYH06_04520 [Chromatiales bacterium]|nr:hypothetical protein [Thiotrichales bacterium]HIP67839.1 hypothetical protein [Chromatiales bacterium]